MTCNCGRKVSYNAKVCPGCGHDFVQAKKDSEEFQDAVISLLAWIIEGAASLGIKAMKLVGLALISPGIVINIKRERYNGITSGLISYALKDWQTWIIALPFAISVILMVNNSLNELSVPKAAKSAAIVKKTVDQSNLSQIDVHYDPLAAMRTAEQSKAKDREISDGALIETPSAAPVTDLPPANNTSAPSSTEIAPPTESQEAKPTLESPTVNPFPAVVSAVRDLFKSPPTPTVDPFPAAPRPRIIAPAPNENRKATDAQIYYSVTGVTRGDTLNVRSGPGTNNSVTAKLSNGDTKIQISGLSVMNDTTEWVHITFGEKSGWVRKQYLKAE